MTRSSGYGYRASAINSSLTWGPYESAVSMKLTPSSTALRRTANALLRSFGGPQMPSPVRRIAPKPRRCTEISPPSDTFPATLAESSFVFMIFLHIFFLANSVASAGGFRRSTAGPAIRNAHGYDLLSTQATVD